MIRCRTHPVARAIRVTPIDSVPHWMCMTCGQNNGPEEERDHSGVLPVVVEEEQQKTG